MDSNRLLTVEGVGRESRRLLMEVIWCRCEMQVWGQNNPFLFKNQTGRVESAISSSHLIARHQEVFKTICSGQPPQAYDGNPVGVSVGVCPDAILSLITAI